MDNSHSEHPTWADLVTAEPRLRALLREIRGVRADSPSFCANKVWTEPGGVKDRLNRLVGWGAGHRGAPAVIGSEAAYDVAYDVLYGALPDCRNCDCAD